jgi:glycosyltransferase involved in cell wall biosynthesis
MIVGIDASNIREGGGLTHLIALLQNTEETTTDIDKIIVWSSNATLDKIPSSKKIEKVSHSFLNKSTLFTFIYQFFYLKKSAKKRNCKVIFAPGGTFISSFRPFVTMSQNMLPFEWEEAQYYGWKMRLRLKILHYTQTYSFKRANGLIFLTNYAKNYITKAISLKKSSTIIPHGVNPAFRAAPRKQNAPSFYNHEKPFEFLYVSYVTVYKHQWVIAEAVCQLHQNGLPIKLKLIGSVLDSFEKVQQVLDNYPNSNECIEYIAGLPHSQLIEHYHQADAFVFGSTCENMPIILIEAMSAGLPIASSYYGPMEEVLEYAAFYFNPREVKDCKMVLENLFNNPEARRLGALTVFNQTKKYTWVNCATDTFKYLVEVANNYKK